MGMSYFNYDFSLNSLFLLFNINYLHLDIVLDSFRNKAH